MCIRALIAIVLCGAVFGGCSYFNARAGLSDDWIGEEYLEDFIESQVGIILDITPSSPE